MMKTWGIRLHEPCAVRYNAWWAVINNGFWNTGLCEVVVVLSLCMKQEFTYKINNSSHECIWKVTVYTSWIPKSVGPQRMKSPKVTKSRPLFYKIGDQPCFKRGTCCHLTPSHLYIEWFGMVTDASTCHQTHHWLHPSKTRKKKINHNSGFSLLGHL